MQFSFSLSALAVTAVLTTSTLSPAYGQESPDGQANVRIERIVVTASAIEKKLIDAPASVTVVTQEELALRSYAGLADALRDIEGIDVGSGQDKNGNINITMRGLPAEYTLVLIDGRRQNDTGNIGPNNFGNSQFMYMPPLASIDRIEVVRGPMSTLYGSDAMGGVINIITKRNLEQWHGDVTLATTQQQNNQYGNDQKMDIYLTGSLADNLTIALRGNGYIREPSEPGYQVELPLPDGSTWSDSGSFGDKKIVGAKTWNLGSTVNYTPSKDHLLSLTYDIAKQRYNNVHGQVGSLDAANNMWRVNANGIIQPRVGYSPYQRVQREQFVLSYIGNFDLGTWTNHLTYSTSENLGRSLPFTLEERQSLQNIWDTAVSAQSTNRPVLTADIEAQINQLFLPRPTRALNLKNWIVDSHFSMLFDNHALVTGLQLLDVAMEDGVFGIYGHEYRAGTTQDHRQLAVFVEDSWNMTPDLTLTTGVRYDDHNVFGGQFSPRAYLNYKISNDWTVKGGVSTGYKAPAPNDLYPGITGFGGQGTMPLVGSPDLQPETSVNYEAAVYYDNGNNFTSNITVFYNEFDDKIIRQDTAPNCEIAQQGERCVDIGEGWAELGYNYFSQYANVDSAVTKGIEVYAEYDINDALRLRANYTHTNSEVRSGQDAGLPLVNTPKHMANLTASYKLTETLSIFLQSEIRGKRYRGTANIIGPQGPETVEQYYKSYELFHLGASYKYNDSWTARARINNLVNNDLSSRTCLLADSQIEYLCSADYNTTERARSFWVSVNYSF